MCTDYKIADVSYCDEASRQDERVPWSDWLSRKQPKM